MDQKWYHDNRALVAFIALVIWLIVDPGSLGDVAGGLFGGIVTAIKAATN